MTKLLGERALKLPFAKQLAFVPISAYPDALNDADLPDIIDDVRHCPAYYQLLVKSLLLPGLMELAEGRAPTHLVICEKDRVLPHPRFTRHFTTAPAASPRRSPISTGSGTSRCSRRPSGSPT